MRCVQQCSLSAENHDAGNRSWFLHRQTALQASLLEDSQRTLRGVEALGIQELADVAIARRGGIGRQLRRVPREAVQAVVDATRGATGAQMLRLQLRRLQARRHRADGPRREGGYSQGALRGTAAAALGAAVAPAGQPAGKGCGSR